MNPNFLAYGLVAAVVIIGLWLGILELRLRRVFGGKRARELEGVLREITEELGALRGSAEEIERYLTSVERRLRRSAQYMGIVRFNPFPDAGGDQSFAIAIMDEKKNGIVISSLFARETSRLYAKPLENGHSRYQLSREELQAIEEAFLRTSE